MSCVLLFPGISHVLLSTAKISANFPSILRRNRFFLTCPHPHSGSGGLKPPTDIPTTSRPHHTYRPLL